MLILVIWMEEVISNEMEIWKPDIVSGNLNDVELKVLSRYLLNQQDIINKLSEENQKLVAEVQVLRDIVDDLSNINNTSVNKKLKLREVKRRTSPFRK